MFEVLEEGENFDVLNWDELYVAQTLQIVNMSEYVTRKMWFHSIIFIFSSFYRFLRVRVVVLCLVFMFVLVLHRLNCIVFIKSLVGFVIDRAVTCKHGFNFIGICSELTIAS